MKYLRISNQSDLVPRIAVLGRDDTQGPWIELCDLTSDDDVGSRVFGHFDENTTLVEAPIAYINIMYALLYTMGLRERADGNEMCFDDVGRPQLHIADDWYMVITSETVSIYR